MRSMASYSSSAAAVSGRNCSSKQGLGMDSIMEYPAAGKLRSPFSEHSAQPDLRIAAPTAR